MPRSFSSRRSDVARFTMFDYEVSAGGAEVGSRIGWMPRLQHAPLHVHIARIRCSLTQRYS